MYDLIIIGGGPGGYIAAERAGAMGKKVLLIEKRELGGVCLNEGCIPTKTLLNSAKLYAHAKEAAQFGVSCDNVKFDLAKAMGWKRQVISTLVKGIEFQMKKNKVEVVKGEAKFKDSKTVVVGDTEYQGEKFIIATGSSPFVPPIPGSKDNPKVITSTGILEIETMPKKLVVIGGGVIGVEFALLFSNLGVEVYIIEMMDDILPFMDEELAPKMRRAMKDIKIHLKSKVESIEGGWVNFTKNEKNETLEGDLILMAVGRRSNIMGMGFENLGLDIERGAIVVNEKMQTNVPGIYAIGDVTGKSLLAHSASRMGEVAVNVMFGGNDRMRYNAIPWAVYGMLEAAGCGLTEQDAVKQGYNVKTASLPMKANGRFIAENANAPGICKVVVDADSDLLLGVHMIGGVCSEMIYGAAVMLESELRVKDILEIIFPHPTVGEIIKDTLLQLH
jgi:dihydrolipoamide dehydrogenase